MEQFGAFSELRNNSNIETRKRKEHMNADVD